MEEFNIINKQNKDANYGLRLFYRYLQSTLLTNYGKVLKKIGTLSHKDFEQQIEAIKSRKNEWRQELLINKFIPNETKTPLRSLFTALVENYVVPVWEIETSQRKSRESEIAKSA